MRGQPFGLGQRDRRRADRGERRRVEREEAGALHEIEHRQAATRSARGGRWAGHGSARRHNRRPLRACGGRGTPSRHGGRGRTAPADRRTASSRCSGASRSTSGIASSSVGGDDDRAIGVPARRARPCAVASVPIWQIDRLGDRIGEGGIVGEQDRLAGRIMLGLAEQVGGDPFGIVPAVGDDDDLARARRPCRCRRRRRAGAWPRRPRHCRGR